MTAFETKRLPAARDTIAPDGSDVRVLLRLGQNGSMAHFALAAGQTSKAVTHKTVEEIWYFVGGRGEMWRVQDGQPESIVPVESGVCLTIPLGTRFQLRSTGSEPLAVVGVTIPSWPTDCEEAVPVAGHWTPTV